jgi:hypothetical protein
MEIFDWDSAEMQNFVIRVSLWQASPVLDLWIDFLAICFHFISISIRIVLH